MKHEEMLEMLRADPDLLQGAEIMASALNRRDEFEIPFEVRFRYQNPKYIDFTALKIFDK